MSKKSKQRKSDVVKIPKHQVYNIVYSTLFDNGIEYLRNNGNSDVADSIVATINDLANKNLSIYKKTPHKVSITNDNLPVYDIHPKAPNLNDNVSILYVYDDKHGDLRVALRLLAVPHEHKEQQEAIKLVRKRLSTSEDKIYFKKESSIVIKGKSFPSESKLLYSRKGTEHKVDIYPKDFYDNIRYFISVDGTEISERFKSLDLAEKHVIDTLISKIEDGVFGSTNLTINFQDLQHLLRYTFNYYYNSKTSFKNFIYRKWSIELDSHSYIYIFKLRYEKDLILQFGTHNSDILFEYFTDEYGDAFLDKVTDIIENALSEILG